MSSMFKAASNIVIAGGNTFSVNDNSVHYHKNRESEDRLHWETATAAFHNSGERFDPPKCHPNTRLAVLSEIMKWIKWEGDLYSFVMWVYGPAGAGKSAIAQTIAEICDKEMILLATFFFSRNDPSRSSIKPLIATIAYQITLHLPDVRDAILGAVERDPLIFSKSLAVQLKSLIVEPLQPLIEAGFFHRPTSRRLVIIDGLDECSDPKVQQNIVEVLGNAHRQHQLPLIFLFTSRPEQPISLTFSTGVLSSVTTRIALNDSYFPGNDIRLFLTEKFQEITSTHRLHAYIPPHWPPPDVLKQLIKKSSGQFIYASTVINYISSIRHKPHDRLDIVLGIRPSQRDLPFAELDALYMHILSGVEDIDSVLDILSSIIFSNPRGRMHLGVPQIEEFLSLQPGDVELHLGDLSSLVNVGPGQALHILHASLTDFFVDPARSKQFWINPQARHATFARRCLQLLQLKEHIGIMTYIRFSTIYHIKNAEITPELLDDMTNISFDDIMDTFSTNSWPMPDFIPDFLCGLKELSFAEAHILQAVRSNCDKMLMHTLEKYCSFPGFALLLAGLLRYVNAGGAETFFPQIVASLYLGRQRGEGYIFDNTGLSGLLNSRPHGRTCTTGTLEFLTYLAELLENPERSKTHVFDSKSYATASKECLQLCLSCHQRFSKGTLESYRRDKALCRSKPFMWIRRLGVHSRIRKCRRQLKVWQWKSLKLRITTDQPEYASLASDSPEHEYYRSLSYRWALNLLPFLLERSAISLELAGVLHRCTFTTMAQKFRRRTRLAKEAITRYLLSVQVEMGAVNFE